MNACPAKNVIDLHGHPTTPYFYSYGRKPSLTNFRVFGCPIYFKRYEPTFRNKLITSKQQLQRASRGIFVGFPDNSAGWLAYSPDHSQRIVITRDAYFDEDFNSALAFDSKPFAGAIPIRSHLDPNGLISLQNSEPTIIHHTGSVANIGHSPSSFIDHPNQTLQVPTETNDIENELPAADDDDNTDLHFGPIPPNPHHIHMIHNQFSSPLQRDMTLYFQECSECINNNLN